MKLRSFFSLAATFSLSLTAAAAADAPATPSDIALYLSTDATKPAIAHLAVSDALISSAKPAPEAAQAEAGWRTLTLPGPVSGYVESKTSHKDMTITPGTPVHTAPDSNSAVLGNSPSNPALVIKSPGIDWSEVSYPGPVTAYFLIAPSKPAAPTVAPAAAVAATPAPTPTASTPAPASAATPAASGINALPTRPNGTLPTPSRVTATPAGKQADPSDIAHNYFGVLKQRTDTKIGGPTNIRYVLYSAQNQVIALVDLSDVVLPNPLVNYLNKSVKIYGTVYPDSSLPFAVIHAVTLQAN